MRSGFREQDCHEGLAASTESPIRTGHESSRVEIKETTIDQDSALSRFSPRSAESKEAKVARRKTLDWKWGCYKLLWMSSLLLAFNTCSGMVLRNMMGGRCFRSMMSAL